MKNLLIILLAVTFISCNPFLSKEHRRKKKCNRKLERVIDKCPELLSVDTIIDTVIFEVPVVEIDSFIEIRRDTTILEIIKNKKTRDIVREYINNYVPLKDTVVHLIDGYTFKFFNLNGNIGYSVDKPVEALKKPVKIPVKIVKPAELTTSEKIVDAVFQYWWLIILIILTVFGLFYLHKRLFR